jgi:imidazolonepropionase-like amidohydrolase
MLRPSLPWFLRWYIIPRATREIGNPAAGTTAVHALLPERPDLLKIMLDAGVGDLPHLTPEAFAAITAAGHAAGIRSITHVMTSAEALVAVQNGTDALAHMPALDEISDQVAATIVAARVPVVATLAISDLIDPDHPRTAADYLPIEREVAGPELLARLLVPRTEVSPFERAVAAGHDARRRSFATLRRAGVTILAGSDACNPGDLPGAALHLELTKLVEAGLAPGEALRAATADNARFLSGPEADFGVIAVGKRADLVLIAGDPVGHIAELGQITAVILEGSVLTRQALR